MNKFVPYEKLSKKAKHKLDIVKRNDWSGINPITRVADNDKTKYKRKSRHPEIYE